MPDAGTQTTPLTPPTPSTKGKAKGKSETDQLTDNEIKLVCAVMKNLIEETIIDFDTSAVAKEPSTNDASSARARRDTIKRAKGFVSAAPAGGIKKSPSLKFKCAVKQRRDRVADEARRIQRKKARREVSAAAAARAAITTFATDLASTGLGIWPLPSI